MTLSTPAEKCIPAKPLRNGKLKAAVESVNPKTESSEGVCVSETLKRIVLVRARWKE